MASSVNLITRSSLGAVVICCMGVALIPTFDCATRLMPHRVTNSYAKHACVLPYTQVVQSQMEAINFVEEVVEREGIDCSFTKLEGYLMGSEHSKDKHASDPLQLLDKELAAAQRAGLDASKVSKGHGSWCTYINLGIVLPFCVVTSVDCSFE